MAGATTTKQEGLWRGEFGDAYITRNIVTDQRLASLTKHWATILKATDGSPPRSILEVGANIGLNLRAIRRLTDAEFYALEPNVTAREMLVQEKIVPAANVMDGLASSIPLGDGAVDLSFTSGVLIHIHPDHLLRSCSEIYRVTRRYLICIEYFSDKDEEILYRGQTEALFKRDFGAYYLDNFPTLRVVDYGFAWKRMTGLDNLTWWLFEKA